MMIWKDFSFVVTLTLHTGGIRFPFHIRFNFSKDKRSENQKNCVNNLQEKKEAIGEIDRHRLTDIICILTISKIKLVEVVLPNVHLRYSD